MSKLATPVQGALAAALTAFLGAAPAATQSFDAGSVSCEDFMNARGSATYDNGRLWAFGYLAGYYNASDALQTATDADAGRSVEDSLMQMCQGFPDSSLQQVSMLTLSTETHILPAAPHRGFAMETYTCADHNSAKSNDTAKANAAELWAFAFIQGYKNVEDPYTAIPGAYMAPLTNA
ncbi:MAG: HdeA/HdeB family chaperone, partial [Rhodospirillaceae bacterium]